MVRYTTKIVFLLQPGEEAAADEAASSARQSIINRQAALYRHANRCKTVRSERAVLPAICSEAYHKQADISHFHSTNSNRPQGDQHLGLKAPYSQCIGLRKHGCGGDKLPRSRRQQECGEPARDRCISATICSPKFDMDKSKHQVLQYFVHTWMPSRGHTPRGCQVTGFTPVWPGDQDLSKQIISSAFQSESTVSLYSILTVCSRRMQKVNNVTSLASPPEVYAAKALESLREVVEEKRHLSERLILDVSYLVLSEVYVKTPQGHRVYGGIIKALVVKYGGLHKIRPFTAQACLAWDYLISATTLSLPALDPFRQTELLRGQIVASDSEFDFLEMNHGLYPRLYQLEERPRIMAEESHSIATVMMALQSLPPHTHDSVRRLATDSAPKIFRLLTAPFLSSGNSTDGMQANRAVAAADGLAMRIKIRMYLAWVWHSAMRCLSSSDSESGLLSVPELLKGTSKLHGQIEGILHRLQGTPWRMQDEIVLWLAGVGALTADSDADRQRYVRLLARTSSLLSIEDDQVMEDVLRDYPPLRHLSEPPQRSIWGLIRADRLRMGWYSAISTALAFA